MSQAITRLDQLNLLSFQHPGPAPEPNPLTSPLILKERSPDPMAAAATPHPIPNRPSISPRRLAANRAQGNFALRSLALATRLLTAKRKPD